MVFERVPSCHTARERNVAAKSPLTCMNPPFSWITPVIHQQLHNSSKKAVRGSHADITTERTPPGLRQKRVGRRLHEDTRLVGCDEQHPETFALEKWMSFSRGSTSLSVVATLSTNNTTAFFELNCRLIQTRPS